MRSIINSTRIDEFFSSTRRNAQELLPHLVRKLVYATIDQGHLISCRIPVEDEIGLRGYDGRIETDTGNPYIPKGFSAWEMGTGDPQGKAAQEYGRRTKTPGSAVPKDTVFVFVTPHIWEGKDDWACEKKELGPWKDVRAYDGVDLGAWLDSAPAAVARWLASAIGVPVDGLKDLDLFWGELSATYGTTIPPDLIICGRENAASELRTWFESPSDSMAVQGESVEEAMAFVAAAVATMPDSLREHVSVRLVYADQPPAVDYLGSCNSPQFVVVGTVEASRRAAALGNSKLRLIVPRARCAGDSSLDSGDIHLGQIRREACESALCAMGLSEQVAQRIARESKGSLGAVLWMAGKRLDTPLPWTTGVAARELVPLLLAGRWVPVNENDCALLAELSSSDYAHVEKVAATWSGAGGPLIQRGETWDWKGLGYAWQCLAGNIDSTTIRRFCKAVQKVLCAEDPVLDLPPDKRWAAPIYGKEHPYSHALRSGLIGSIVYLSLNDSHVKAGGESVAKALAQDLLDHGVQGWLSLAPWLPDLAEAAPDAFLTCLEKVLGDSREVQETFSGGDPMFGSHPHVYLLWALERLAWSSDFFTRVVLALGELAAVDPGGGLHNSPDNSLKAILVPWQPQTSADTEQRLAALSLLQEQRPDVAWFTAVSLLPGHYQVAYPAAEPAWREWKRGDASQVSRAEYYSFVEELVSKLIEWAENAGEKWGTLVDAYASLYVHNPDLAARVLARLKVLLSEMPEEPDRRAVIGSIRRTLSFHRGHPNAQWAVDEKALGPLEVLYNQFQAENAIDRHKWVFSWNPDLPNLGHVSYEERDQAIECERHCAIRAIYDEQGVNGLLLLADRVESPEQAGLATARALSLDGESEGLLLDRSLSLFSERDNTPARLRFALGFLGGSFDQHGGAWVDRVAGLNSVSWDANSYANLGMGLPSEGPTWDRVEAWGEEANSLYWTRAPIHFLRDPERDGKRAITKLLEVGRPLRALDLVATYVLRRSGKRSNSEPLAIPKELMITVLNEAMKGDPNKEWYPPALNAVGHNVSWLLDALEARGVENATLAKLEWGWLWALEHTQRGLKALQVALGCDPALFVEALRLGYRGKLAEHDTPTERDQALARQAHELLGQWKTVPGLKPKETSPGASGTGACRLTLSDWVGRAQELAEESGHRDACQYHIGQVFAHSPADPAGSWPCELVRDAIESARAEELERGFEIGVSNKRGVIFRGKGGNQERELATRHRRYAQEVRSRWPRTAAVLERIAARYEQEAREWDERDALEEFA